MWSSARCSCLTRLQNCIGSLLTLVTTSVVRFPQSAATQSDIRGESQFFLLVVLDSASRRFLFQQPPPSKHPIAFPQNNIQFTHPLPPVPKQLFHYPDHFDPDNFDPNGGKRSTTSIFWGQRAYSHSNGTVDPVP